MLRFFLATLLLLASTLGGIARSADPIAGLLQRILPHGGDAQRFEYSLQPSSTGQDYFTLSCDGQRIRIVGNEPLSVATGVHWFLQRKLGIDIAWNNPTDRLPSRLPFVPAETHRAQVDVRYYLNFCTHSYTMAFWDWERWQQEIDWMALHGVTMPLIITGMESVWREMLTKHYGYRSLTEVNEFTTGGAYYGWFFMNNMTAWGGPQPASWYDQRTALARRIFRRLGEYGMEPLIPGYVGMVPSGFLQHATRNVAQWKPQDIVGGGQWCAFERPHFVNDTSRLQEMAAAYYEAVEHLYGDVLSTHHYAIDPFHEGSVPQGVSSARASIRAMWQALTTYDAEAVWVAQHWQHNPTEDLTHTVPQGRLLILNLHGDSHGQTQLGGANSDAQGRRHLWVWGMTSNFGGNVGLFGRVERIIRSFQQAHQQAVDGELVGIGALPEGIEQNPMLYSLLFSLPWMDGDYSVEQWVNDYVKMRYGVDAQTDAAAYELLVDIWHTLANGIYNCPSDRQQGTTESVFLMRPAERPASVSTWANSSWYWDIAALRKAAEQMLSLAPRLGHKANYRYDLVDIMRQALADEAKLTLDSIATAEGARKERLQQRFLAMLLAQDRLLGTLPDFRLGRWLEQARSLGRNASERQLYERNARMLLTTWGDRLQCEQGQLHDYANREWQGLLASYYYPRWAAYFAANSQPLRWFDDYEWPFATGALGRPNVLHLPPTAAYDYGSFKAKPEGHPLHEAKEVWERYLKK